jgi:hypothetical protein
MKKCKECKMTFEKLNKATTNIDFLSDCGSCMLKFYISYPFNVAIAEKSSDKDKVLNIFFNEHKKIENKI